MNNMQKSYCRDNQIIDDLEKWQVLDAIQIQLLYFDSKRTAQRRLKRLAEMKKIKRLREFIGQPYVYFLNKKPAQLQHKLGVNWCRIYINKSLKSWEQVTLWQYEVDYKTLRADGFCCIRNLITNKERFIFIEYDRGFNDFDKVQKYNDLYLSGSYMNTWWIARTDVFPSILIITENDKYKIIKKITNENTANLDFKVIHVSEIKELLVHESYNANCI